MTPRESLPYINPDLVEALRTAFPAAITGPTVPTAEAIAVHVGQQIVIEWLATRVGWQEGKPINRN